MRVLTVWALGLIAALGAPDALAKDVAGMFLGAFVVAGGVAGLFAGVTSALLSGMRFWRGAALALGLSLLPWAALLLYWNFPFPSKTFIGNLPFMLFVLIGTVPLYLAAYGLARMFARGA